MNPLTPSPPQKMARHRAWRIVAGYGIFATLWIVLSDRALAPLMPRPELMMLWSLVKGLAFVALTSLLLCEDLPQEHRHHFRVPAASLLVQMRGHCPVKNQLHAEQSTATAYSMRYLDAKNR